MDITPQDTTQQPMSDDQELAKALAGVMPETSDPNPAPQEPEEFPQVPTMQFEETPVQAPVQSTPAEFTSDLPPLESALPPIPEIIEAPAAAAYEAPVQTSQANGDLEGIKKDALVELRPLIDKVDLPAEEKFDTYLMLIRSTDDASLIGPAHVIAQSITDEKRRAEALLDIIKEIDFLSHTDQAAA